MPLEAYRVPPLPGHLSNCGLYAAGTLGSCAGYIRAISSPSLATSLSSSAELQITMINIELIPSRLQLTSTAEAC